MTKNRQTGICFHCAHFCTGRGNGSGQARAVRVFIPKAQRARSLYGTEFEIQLHNKLTQHAVARECAAWIRKKATFRSNKTKAPMQQFVGVDGKSEQIAYIPHGSMPPLRIQTGRGKRQPIARSPSSEGGFQFEHDMRRYVSRNRRRHFSISPAGRKTASSARQTSRAEIRRSISHALAAYNSSMTRRTP